MVAQSSTINVIRNATSIDLPAVKRLADDHKRELGFVLNPALREAILEKRVVVALGEGNRLVGFIHFRHRRDGVTKVYQICIEGECRRRGYGFALLSKLVEDALTIGQDTISLSCPEDLAANEFYKACGFTQDGHVRSPARRLVQWKLRIVKDKDALVSENDT